MLEILRSSGVVDAGGHALTVIIAGTIGSLIHTLTSFGDYVGNRRLSTTRYVILCLVSARRRGARRLWGASASRLAYGARGRRRRLRDTSALRASLRETAT